jgi:hypothetical protein
MKCLFKDAKLEVGKLYQTSRDPSLLAGFYHNSVFKVLEITDTYIYYCYMSGDAVTKDTWEVGSRTSKHLKSFGNDQFEFFEVAPEKIKSRLDLIEIE